MSLILVIAIIFFIIHIWQSFSHGRSSPIISGISFIVALLMFLMYDGKIGLFFFSSIISWLILMRIFTTTTYHGTFFKFFYLLVVYAIFIGLLINAFFYDLFFYYFVAISIMLILNFLTELRSWSQLKFLYGDNQEVRESFNNTLKFYLLSAFCFLMPLLFICLA